MSHCNGHRWSKFWWRDYQGDAALRMCSLAARGYWMELLCIAHEATPVGHVLINRKQPSHRQLAAIAGCKEREARKFEEELENSGVFSRLEDGTIYCRRMVRDWEASEAGREHIAKRWNGAKQPKEAQKAPPTTTPPPNRVPISEPTSQAYRPPTRDATSDPFTRSRREKKESEREGGSPAGNSHAPARATPRRRLPDDWQPNGISLALGLDHGLTQHDIHAEAEKMRDWANHRAEIGANWDARFNNWLRKEATDRSRYRQRIEKPTLQQEWNLPSFLTPHFADDDEPPMRPSVLLS